MVDLWLLQSPLITFACYQKYCCLFSFFTFPLIFHLLSISNLNSIFLPACTLMNISDIYTETALIMLISNPRHSQTVYTYPIKLSCYLLLSPFSWPFPLISSSLPISSSCSHFFNILPPPFLCAFPSPFLPVKSHIFLLEQIWQWWLAGQPYIYTSDELL